MRRSKIKDEIKEQPKAKRHNSHLNMAKVFGGPTLYVEVNKAQVYDYGIEVAYTVACLQKYIEYTHADDLAYAREHKWLDERELYFYPFNLDHFCNISCVEEDVALKLLYKIKKLTVGKSPGIDLGFGFTAMHFQEQKEFDKPEEQYIYQLYIPAQKKENIDEEENE